MRYGWCLLEADWSALREELTHLPRWRSSQLLVANALRIPSGEPGVYVLCAPPSLNDERSREDLLRALYGPLYVGRTEDLRRRFLEHCRAPQPRIESSLRIFGGLDFWYCRVEQTLTRRVEARLIKCLGPSANRINGIVGSIGPAQPA